MHHHCCSVRKRCVQAVISTCIAGFGSYCQSLLRVHITKRYAFPTAWPLLSVSCVMSPHQICAWACKHNKCKPICMVSLSPVIGLMMKMKRNSQNIGIHSSRSFQEKLFLNVSDTWSFIGDIQHIVIVQILMMML